MSLEPTKNGTLWCISSGVISRIFLLLLIATPPACSAINAIGLHSYNSLSFPLGYVAVLGYKNIPPFKRFLWKSATKEPMYLDVKGLDVSLSISWQYLI